MALTLSEVQDTILRSGFSRGVSTSKLIEFVANQTGRRIYVYKYQGFPDHADVIVHPEADRTMLFAIDGVLPNKRVEYRFGSNMTEFPKRLNKGAAPEHFGLALYVFSAMAVKTLCTAYDR
jgi:hypothetical protein